MTQWIFIYVVNTCNFLKKIGVIGFLVFDQTPFVNCPLPSGYSNNPRWTLCLLVVLWFQCLINRNSNSLYVSLISQRIHPEGNFHELMDIFLVSLDNLRSITVTNACNWFCQMRTIVVKHVVQLRGAMANFLLCENELDPAKHSFF